jgi:PAS domain S-box-containing protein
MNKNLQQMLCSEEEATYIESFYYMADSIPHIAWTAEPNGTVNFNNKSRCEFLGLDPEKGRFAEISWRSVVHPDDIDDFERSWKKAINTRSIFFHEYRLKRSDGKYEWHLASATPKKSSKGNVITWVGECVNIHLYKKKSSSAKKQIDKLMHELRVLQAQNNALDILTREHRDFIYTISHDLKAPVANIEALLSILKKSNKEERDEIIGLIEASIWKFKGTLNEAMKIPQKEEADEPVAPLYFEDILKEVEFNISRQIENSKAVIRTDFSQVPQIIFSRKNLYSIFLNLITNAIKYRSPEREPEIFLKTEKIEEFVLVTIKDNGIGMQIKKGSNIFAKFKRLHDHVEGSGVGLYLVKSIIDNAGGSIEVESEPGKGTVFKVYIKDMQDLNKPMLYVV